MSMKLMVRVMEEIEVTRPQQLVLLAMAENARDDGTQCYPSVDLIAWKAGYKPRAVSDILRELRDAGIIELVRPAADHRPTEYALHLDRAPRKPAFEEWIATHGRYRERRKRDASRTGPRLEPAELARENAPREEDRHAISRDTACNLTSYGMQSHVPNPELARENAPEPVIEPVKNQSENRERSRATRRARSTSTPLPDDFMVTNHMRAKAVDDYHVPPETIAYETEKFCNHAIAKGLRYVDWRAAWYTWMQRVNEFSPGISGRATSRASPPPNLRTHDHDDDTVDWLGEYASAARGQNR